MNWTQQFMVVTIIYVIFDKKDTITIASWSEFYLSNPRVYLSSIRLQNQNTQYTSADPKVYTGNNIETSPYLHSELIQ